MGPMSYRRFEELVKSYGCSIRKTAKEYETVDSKGMRISSFSVTHGKKTKGNEVLAFYVKKFLKEVEKNVQQEKSDEQKGN